MFEYALNDMRPLIGMAALVILMVATLGSQLRSRREDDLLERAVRGFPSAETAPRLARGDRVTRLIRTAVQDASAS